MRHRKIRKENIGLVLLVGSFLLLLGLFGEKENKASSYGNSTSSKDQQVQTEKSPDVKNEVEETMKVHFLDVEQGLSILVQLGDEVLIYDGGDSDTSSFVVAYLKEQGIKEIDYMISSHYDSDHLSGLIGCLNAFEVENVIASNYEHDSRLYTSFYEAVEAEGIEAQYPAVGTEYSFGDAKFTILSPAKIKSDSNANSVAIKLSYGESDFIFTGDADYSSEKAMVASGIDLEVEVLSLGHHGSSSSSSSLFLEKTVPEYAVISCGKGNSYGHPHEEVVELLEAMEINVFRSDMQGTVVATTDGKEITWSTEPCNDYSDGE